MALPRHAESSPLAHYVIPSLQAQCCLFSLSRRIWKTCGNCITFLPFFMKPLQTIRVVYKVLYVHKAVEEGALINAAWNDCFVLCCSRPWIMWMRFEKVGYWQLDSSSHDLLWHLAYCNISLVWRQKTYQMDREKPSQRFFFIAVVVTITLGDCQLSIRQAILISY